MIRATDIASCRRLENTALDRPPRPLMADVRDAADAAGGSSLLRTG